MTASHLKLREPLAIIGAEAIMPGSVDGAQFWRNIVAGKDLISDVPESHWRIADYYDPNPKARDKTYGRRGGFVPDIPFDPMAFGLPPALLPHTDTSQLLALVTARRLMDAIQGKPTARDRVGVILGTTTATELMIHMGARMRRPHWEAALRSEGYDEAAVARLSDRIADTFTEWTEDSFPGQLGNVIAGRIANRLDLNGTNVIVDAACAGSLAAVHAAANELYLGDSDMVITGGVDTLNDILMYMCFSKTPAMSPTGDCRPFSAEGDGMLLGEGVALFALRKLVDAERDGNPILAVIRGIGSSSDGLSKSIYAPLPEGQAKAIARAYEKAGYGPNTVELIEAHGTATLAGDAAETAGLKAAFGAVKDTRVAEVALGSVKSQVGHTKSAAGAAGLFKAVMAVHHGILPPTLKVAHPNAKLKLEGTPLYVNTEARPWVSAAGQPRRAGVSSFGFGGTNFHVTLEEYTGAGARAPRLRADGAELLLLSAVDGSALAVAARALATECSAAGGLSALARETQRLFDAGASVRASVVAHDLAEAASHLASLAIALDQARPSEMGAPHADVCWDLRPARPGKVAYVFPGQGSQYPNMTAALAMTFPQALGVWDAIATQWPVDAGARLDRIVFPPPAFDQDGRALQRDNLTRMENAQPAIGGASLSMLAVLQTLGLKPDAVAGHSFGEVTALHAAGVLSSADTLKIARTRGALMAQSAEAANQGGTRGAMIAVAASREQIAQAGALPDGVVFANLNSPRQTVLSGPAAAIDQAASQLKQHGWAVTALPVSGAFHSPQMAAAVAPFAKALADDVTWSHAHTPIYANSSAALYPTKGMQDVLAEQITAPVRFAEMIARMIADGITTFVEVGPGAALTGLVKQIAGDGGVQAVALDHHKAPLRTFWRGLGALAVQGHALAFDALWKNIETPPREKPPVPKHAVMINGSNVGRPDLAAMTATRRTTAPPTSHSQQHVQTDAMSTPSASKPSADHLATLYEIARQTHEAHVAYTRAMTDAHNTFLTLAAQTVAAMGGQEAGALLAQMPAMPMSQQPAAPVSPAPFVPPPMPTFTAPTLPAAQPGRPGVDMASAVLAAVAEKTGYPVEALSMEMSLETDLGIDSIKRVEIFSALSGLSPEAAALSPEAMGDIVTLADVMAAIGASGQTPVTAAPPPPAPKVDIGAAVLAAVAEKTGYPVDALSMEMSLETDLGIDSIKRVEIFSALSHLSPSAAALSPEAMGDIVTLADVMDAIGAKVSGSPPPPEAGATVPLGELSGDRADRLVCAVPERIALTESATVVPQEAVIGIAVAPTLDAGDALQTNLVAALKAKGYTNARPFDADNPPPVDMLVVLGFASGDATPEKSLALHRFALACARAAAKSLRTRKGSFLVIQDSGGAFALAGSLDERVWFGGLSGLGKTAAREWPEVVCRNIDFARDGLDAEILVQRLAEEVVRDERILECAIGPDGVRYQIVTRDIDIGATVPSNLATSPDMPVLLVTGGARGVTAHALKTFVEALPMRADRPRARILVVGRSSLEEQEESATAVLADEAALKSHFIAAMKEGGVKMTPAKINARIATILAQREARATCAALRAAGAEVRYVTLDVRDAAAVTALLSESRADWGPFSGFIHGAGVLEDKAIADKTDAQMGKVFSTKVDGLFHILAALNNDPLRWMAFFSSIAARHGNPGQSDYAMANEVLNRVARFEQQRRGARCCVRSYNWGPWNGGMVTPELGALFVRRGLGLIDLDAGAALMCRGLLDPTFLPGQTELVVHAPLADAQTQTVPQVHAAQ